MPTAYYSGLAFLNEQGVIITRTHLSAGGQSFDLSKIHTVKLERMPMGPVALLRGQCPTLRLVVFPAVDATPVTVLQTQDTAFIQRVMKAMDLAAAAHRRAKGTL